MHSIDGDELFLEIVLRGDFAIDNHGFRLQNLKDFEFIGLFHRDEDAIILQAELCCRFRAIVGDEDFLRRRLTADFSFIRCMSLRPTGWSLSGGISRGSSDLATKSPSSSRIDRS
jgi:hypothetical protein